MSLMDKFKESVGKVAETGSKATRVGQLKLGINTLQSKLNDLYADLGYRCYQLHLEERVRIFDDPKIVALCKEVTELLPRLEEKKLELDQLVGSAEEGVLD